MGNMIRYSIESGLGTATCAVKSCRNIAENSEYGQFLCSTTAPRAASKGTKGIQGWKDGMQPNYISSIFIYIFIYKIMLIFC
jgi:hypothetical protein